MQICLWSFSLFVCCTFRLFTLTNLHIELDWLIPDLIKFKTYWLLTFCDSNSKCYIWVMLFGHDSIWHRIWQIQKKNKFMKLMQHYIVVSYTGAFCFSIYSFCIDILMIIFLLFQKESYLKHFRQYSQKPQIFYVQVFF